MLFNVSASARLFSADKLIRAALLSALCGRSHAQESTRNAFTLVVNQRGGGGLGGAASQSAEPSAPASAGPCGAAV